MRPCAAQEEHDLKLMVDLYAEDVVLRRVDRNNPPSSPVELRGKEQIADYWRDIFERNMIHRVEDAAAGEDRVAFKVACEYADGTKVLAAENLEVCNGKIVREVSVQAWVEEAECKGSGMEVPALLLAPIHRSAKILSSSRLQSPLAQHRSSSYRTTLRPLWSPKKSVVDKFVARIHYEQLRLATLLVPENFHAL